MIKGKLSKKKKKVNVKKQARINKRKALIEWSKQVRERDNYTCQVCGIKKGEMTKNGKEVVFNAHHVISKEGFYSSLMFEIDNGICLCQDHHRFSRKISPHRQEFVFFNWFMKNKPEQFQKLVDMLNNLKVNNE